MMTKPGITELDRCVDSRYTLVSMAAKRARMIGIERKKAELADASSYDAKADKAVTQAVNEISQGVVGYVRSEAVEKAREYEEEKYEAIMQLERGLADETSSDTSADSENTEKEPENGSFIDSVIDAAAAQVDSEDF